MGSLRTYGFRTLYSLAELDVERGTKVPRVHGAVAPGEPLAAAHYFHKTTI